MDPSAREVITRIAGKLVLREGIYKHSAISHEISYPAAGCERFFSVEDEAYWYKHRNDCIRTVVEKFGLKGVVLDVGGGNGVVSKMFAEAGLSPVLVEPYVPSCQNAKNRGIENIICSFLKDLDFTQTQVGMIGAFDVVEHIENDDEFLGQIHKALAPQGKLLMAVPAHQMLWSGIDDYLGHYRRYSKDSLNSLLIRNGFTVLHFTYFFNCLVLPVLLFRRLPYLLGRKIDAQNYKVKKRDYVIQNDVLQGLLSLFLKNEIDRLKKGSVSNGTSILVLAAKIA